MIITLPNRIDMQTVKALKTCLTEAVGQDTELDAANVEWVGGLGAQLLLSARLYWDKTEQSLSIKSPSDAFTEGLKRLGISNNLSPNEES